MFKYVSFYFSLVIYYYMAVAAGNRKMVELLKEQLALVCTLYLRSRFSEMKSVCFVVIAEYETRDIVSKNVKIQNYILF